MQISHFIFFILNIILVSFLLEFNYIKGERGSNNAQFNVSAICQKSRGYNKKSRQKLHKRTNSQSSVHQADLSGYAPTATRHF